MDGHACCWQTPLGALTARESNGMLVALHWAQTDCRPDEDCRLLQEVRRQVDEYLDGRRRAFELPVCRTAGTEFQRQVWLALQDIPYGETRSYAEVARAIGRPRAARAVGMANHRNPVAVIVPCHRVIGGNGSLTGYAGGLDIKKRLLQLEAEHRR